MYRDKISERQLRIWLATALAAPTAAYSGGNSWMDVVLAIAMGLGTFWLLEKLWEPGGKLPVWLGAIQLLWLGIYTGRLAGYTSSFWPEGVNVNAVPLVLIALSCFAAQKGVSCGRKSASVLFWFVVPALVGVFLAGKNNVKVEWILDGEPNWKPELYSLMLIPASTITLMPAQEKRRGVLPLVAAGILGLSAVAVINGSLSRIRSTEMVNPLYEYSKSVTLLGTVKGLEAVVACGLTAGWFALISLTVSMAGIAAEQVNTKWARPGVWVSGLIAGVTLLLGVGNMAVETAISGVIWCVIPAVEGIRKKLKK